MVNCWLVVWIWYESFGNKTMDKIVLTPYSNVPVTMAI